MRKDIAGRMDIAEKKAAFDRVQTWVSKNLHPDMILIDGRDIKDYSIRSCASLKIQRDEAAAFRSQVTSEAKAV